MSKFALNLFNHEVSVAYRGDDYLVRDNGAVCRQRRENKRERPLDDVWTFGTFNVHDGYRKICSTPVHRIVATAFHGEQRCGKPGAPDDESPVVGKRRDVPRVGRSRNGCQSDVDT